MRSNDVVRTTREVYAEKTTETITDDSSYYLPEKYQLGILTEWFSRHEVSYTTEAEVFCYPIDVLASKYETTVAIELKSRNIGKGIDQALRNSDFVDYSYLSVWESDVTDALLTRVANEPIGLLGIDEDVIFHSYARESPQQLCTKSNVLSLIRDNVRGNTSVQQQSGQTDD